MKSFSSVAEQVATHLSEELRRGRWRELMPGRSQLVKELGVSGKTVDLALQQLEHEGLLVAQGKGQPRRIQMPDNIAAPTLRVGILCHDEADRNRTFMVNLHYLLAEAGHVVSFAPKTMSDLGVLRNVAGD